MRVGVIGTGYWARAIHGASAAQHADVELVGVWGRDAGKAAGAADELGVRAYGDVDALIEDTEALTFAVPPDVQVDIALRAASRGRHLLLEKPLATTVSDARRLEQAVTDAGVASIIFFTRRFRGETADWLRQLVELGGWECGRIEVTANIFVAGNPFAESPWRREKGALWDVGPHALSVLCPVLGEVRSVVAGRGRRDQVHLVLAHADGGSSTASLSLTAPQAAVGGETLFYGEHGRQTAPAAASGDAQVVAAHQRALDALIALAREPGRGHPCDVHFGRRVVEVLAAAEQALAAGRAVEVDGVG